MNPVPKTLLITMTPPGSRNVGEVILRDLCTLLPADRVCVFAVAGSDPEPSPYTTSRYPAPGDDPWRPAPGGLGALLNYARVRTSFATAVRRMADVAVEFGRQERVERVWLTLNSLPLIAGGATVARRLQVPLHSLVWDPPDYLARRRLWDRASRRWLATRFAEALRCSQRVAVVSEGMAESYAREHGARCVVLRHAVEGGPLTAEPLSSRADEPIRIGFAGTLYEASLLDVLVHGLNAVSWRYGNRPVTLRMIGNWFRFNGLTGPCRIELLGWQSTEETRRLLGECDLCYLPISFGADWDDFARLSFPTKLSTYLAAGRPVLVHGPTYCSAAQFCASTGCGETSTEDSAASIMAALGRLLGDAGHYRACAAGARAACREWFSQEVMRRQFALFLQPDDAGSPVRA